MRGAPEGSDVLGASVLVLEVVGMLPHVEPQEGDHLRPVHPVHQRVVLVGKREGKTLLLGGH